MLVLDLTGALPDNRLGLPLTVKGLTTATLGEVLTSPYGIFYDSVSLIDTGTGLPLTQNEDFVVGLYDKTFYAETNQLAYRSIVLLNSQLVGPLMMYANYVGGDYQSVTSVMLPSVLDKALVTSRQVAWSDFINIPDEDNAKEHTHPIEAFSSGYQTLAQAILRVLKAKQVVGEEFIRNVASDALQKLQPAFASELSTESKTISGAVNELWNNLGLLGANDNTDIKLVGVLESGPLPISDVAVTEYFIVGGINGEDITITGLWEDNTTSKLVPFGQMLVYSEGTIKFVSPGTVDKLSWATSSFYDVDWAQDIVSFINYLYYASDLKGDDLSGIINHDVTRGHFNGLSKTTYYHVMSDDYPLRETINIEAQWGEGEIITEQLEVSYPNTLNNGDSRFFTQFDEDEESFIVTSGPISMVDDVIELEVRFIAETPTSENSNLIGLYTDDGTEELGLTIGFSNGKRVLKLYSPGYTPDFGISDVFDGKLHTAKVQINKATGEYVVWLDGNVDYTGTHSTPDKIADVYRVSIGARVRTSQIGGQIDSYSSNYIADVSVYSGGVLVFDMPIDGNYHPGNNLVDNNQTTLGANVIPTFDNSYTINGGLDVVTDDSTLTITPTGTTNYPYVTYNVLEAGKSYKITATCDLRNCNNDTFISVGLAKVFEKTITGESWVDRIRFYKGQLKTVTTVVTATQDTTLKFFINHTTDTQDTENPAIFSNLSVQEIPENAPCGVFINISAGNSKDYYFRNNAVVENIATLSNNLLSSFDVSYSEHNNPVTTVSNNTLEISTNGEKNYPNVYYPILVVGRTYKITVTCDLRNTTNRAFIDVGNNALVSERVTFNTGEMVTKSAMVTANSSTNLSFYLNEEVGGQDLVNPVIFTDFSIQEVIESTPFGTFTEIDTENDGKDYWVTFNESNLLYTQPVPVGTLLKVTASGIASFEENFKTGLHTRSRASAVQPIDGVNTYLLDTVNELDGLSDTQYVTGDIVVMTKGGVVDDDDLIPLNGQLLDMTEYSELFSLLGHQFGGNVSDNTFGLPHAPLGVTRSRLVRESNPLPERDIYLSQDGYGGHVSITADTLIFTTINVRTRSVVNNVTESLTMFDSPIEVIGVGQAGTVLYVDGTVSGTRSIWSLTNTSGNSSGFVKYADLNADDKPLYDPYWDAFYSIDGIELLRIGGGVKTFIGNVSVSGTINDYTFDPYRKAVYIATDVGVHRVKLASGNTVSVPKVCTHLTYHWLDDVVIGVNAGVSGVVLLSETLEQTTAFDTTSVEYDAGLLSLLSLEDSDTRYLAPITETPYCDYYIKG